MFSMHLPGYPLGLPESTARRWPCARSFQGSMRILRFRTLTLSKRGTRLRLRRLEEAMNNRGVSPFAVIGISGTAGFYRGIELQAGVNNLFDRNYAIVDGYPEAGRTAYVNLRYRF